MLTIPTNLTVSQIPLSDLRNVLNMMTAIRTRMTSGVPEQKQPGTERVIMPALSAEQYRAMIGPENAALLEGALAVLNGEATATPK